MARHYTWEFRYPVQKSLDSGTTFPNDIKNLSSNVGFSLFAKLAVSGNTVHVVWDDDTPGNRDILYRNLWMGEVHSPI